MNKFETNGFPFVPEAELDTGEIHDFNLNDMLEPLNCSNNIVCTNSENITNEDVNEFLMAYHQQTSKFKTYTECTERDSKCRTIAKSFVPQSCIQYKKINKFNKDIDIATTKEKQPTTFFKTAKEELDIQNIKKHGTSTATSINGGQKKKLGTRRGVQGKFISPLLSNGDM